MASIFYGLNQINWKYKYEIPKEKRKREKQEGR